MMSEGPSYHVQQEQANQQQIVEENMSNLTSASGDQASGSSSNRTESGINFVAHQQHYPPPPAQTQPTGKRKRNQPGNPDPDAEVLALSPKTLLATNRFVCEICNKGFQRDQNLQLHRRGHNLPWKLKQRANKEVIRKKVYVCPEPSCVHHDPSRALGDLTGIKKHFCRKHGEKKWKCDKCSKRYAVQSDWKAHSKTCGTREYRCDCGTLFSRRDSFITHRAFCDALAEESARSITAAAPENPLGISQHQHQQGVHPSSMSPNLNLQVPQLNINPHGSDLHAFALKKEQQHSDFMPSRPHNEQHHIPPWLAPPPRADNHHPDQALDGVFHEHHYVFTQAGGSNPNHDLAHTGLYHMPSFLQQSATPSAHMSATALLQKAAQMGSTISSSGIRQANHESVGHGSANLSQVPTQSTSLAATAVGFGLPGFGTKAHDHNSSSTRSNPNNIENGNSNNPSLFHLVMSSAGLDHGGSFDDAFSRVLRTNASSTTTGNAAATQGGKDDDQRGDGGEGMTRDFLGLTSLSHSDILNFAGLGNCIRASSHHDDEQPQKPWLG